MTSISDLQKEYLKKIDFFDLEIIIANSLAKTREFVLAYPEYEIPKNKIKKIKLKISRRMCGEPIAYIVGHKEFYGLDFIVNKHTLIPRPETEQIIDLMVNEILILQLADKFQVSNLCIADIGTGSGNIIISIAKTLENFKNKISDLKLIGVDISKDALKIAKKNSKLSGLDKKIYFFQGDLLSPIIENPKLELGNSKMIIIANLPYLSKEIFNSAPIDVKKFEPRSALYSPKNGLGHYEKLLKQIKKITRTNNLSIIIFLEISPEQKKPLEILIKSIFPRSKIFFFKDLANKWRVAKIEI